MCDKPGDYYYYYALELVPDCYKTYKMCDKPVDTYSSAIQFVPECCKTQKMCHKALAL